MSLKWRFAVLFSLFVSVILMASFTSIFVLYEEFRKEEFTRRITDHAIEISNAFTGLRNSGVEIVEKADRQSINALVNETIVIYDTAYRLLFKRPVTVNPVADKQLLNAAKRRGNLAFTDGDREAVVLYINSGQSKHFIVASAFDRYGRRKIENLKYILIFTFLGGLVLSGLFAFFYVRQIIKPVGELNRQMQRITENNLNERLATTRNNNELSRIANNFNDMLDRLQQSFEMRKSFVHHASHELRTPLASMLSQTEAALHKEGTPEEYKKVLVSLKEDQMDLIELTNSLLLLSRYESYKSSIEWALLRIDEIIYDIIDMIKEVYPQANINLEFVSVPEDSNLLTIKGNGALIGAALRNLVKNAYLYSSDRKVNILIDAGTQGIKIVFDNKGKQLNSEEQKQFSIPFFRGENAANIKGTGLGLSIAERIITLHKGQLRYKAVQDNVNRFILYFPFE